MSLLPSVLRLVHSASLDAPAIDPSSAQLPPAARAPALTATRSVILPRSTSHVARAAVDPLNSLLFPSFPRSTSEALAVSLLPPSNSRQVTGNEIKANESAIIDKILSANETENSAADAAAETKAEEVEATPECEVNCTCCYDTVRILPPSHAAKAEYYDCGATGHVHVQCATCFGQYIKTCSESYFEGSLPIFCPESVHRSAEERLEQKCSGLVPESEIMRILSMERNRTILPIYERACLLSGIIDISERADKLAKENESKKEEERQEPLIPFTCSKCGDFTALVPRNYKARAEKLKTLLLKEADLNHVREEPQPSALDYLQRMLEESAIEDEIKAETDDLPPAAPDQLKRQPSTGLLTSLFFECERSECGGITCLRCSRVIPPEDRASHSCGTDQLEAIYEELLGVLAEASTRRCPECNKTGLKDEACCNIHCADGHDDVTWCYCCGRSTNSDPDYWNHNNFSFDSDDSKSCPQYLQYRFYSESLQLATSGRFDYAGEKAGKAALQRFHILLQKQAVDNWKQMYAHQPEKLVLIEECIAKFFPYGLFDREHLEGIEKIELIRSSWNQCTDVNMRFPTAKAVMEWLNSRPMGEVLKEIETLEDAGGITEKRKQYLSTKLTDILKAVEEAERAKREKAEQERKEAEEQRRRERELRYQAQRSIIEEQRRRGEEIRRQRELERKTADETAGLDSAQDLLDGFTQRERDRERRNQLWREARERENKEREELQLRLQEIALRQEEEFRRLRAEALRRRNLLPAAQAQGEASNAADRRRQRREMERLRLMALRNEQLDRIQQIGSRAQQQTQEEKKQ